MTHIIQTEWLKIKSYRAFWWVMAITALSYPGINYIFFNAYKEITKKGSSTGEMAKMLLGNPFVFPETFHTAGFFSSFFVFIPAIVVIMMITNEYTFKTHRQNIIDGWSRNEFLIGKFIDVLLITLLVTLLYFTVAIIIGFASTKAPVQDIFSKSSYVGLFALANFFSIINGIPDRFPGEKIFYCIEYFYFLLSHCGEYCSKYFKSKSE